MCAFERCEMRICKVNPQCAVQHTFWPTVRWPVTLELCTRKTRIYDAAVVIVSMTMSEMLRKPDVDGSQTQPGVDEATSRSRGLKLRFLFFAFQTRARYLCQAVYLSICHAASDHCFVSLSCDRGSFYIYTLAFNLFYVLLLFSL